MTPGEEYDRTLSDQIRQELGSLGPPSPDHRSQLAALIARLEHEFRSFLSDPARRSRTLDFLRGSAEGTPSGGGPDASVGEPVRRSLEEMSSMSSRLDSVSDASQGFSFAEGVVRRAHEIARDLDGALAALDPKQEIAAEFHRLALLVSRLIRNAVAKLREFARLLGVSSFSLAFASDPPCVTVTFTFGSG
jgi:hypothetical protein